MDQLTLPYLTAIQATLTQGCVPGQGSAFGQVAFADVALGRERARCHRGVVTGHEAVDGLNTPEWMHVVADSEMTARVLAKARRNGDQLREARASADSRSATFVNAMRDRADRARECWQPGTTWEWWITASRDVVLAAYIAALESSGIDEQAAVAAHQACR